MAGSGGPVAVREYWAMLSVNQPKINNTAVAPELLPNRELSVQGNRYLPSKTSTTTSVENKLSFMMSNLLGLYTQIPMTL
jgi:hypothetical protein